MHVSEAGALRQRGNPRSSIGPLLETPGSAPARGDLTLLHVKHPMIRDTDNIPYRKTAAYKRALIAAAQQKAAMHHQVRQLWPSQSGQSTSGMLRRPRFGYAV